MPGASAVGVQCHGVQCHSELWANLARDLSGGDWKTGRIAGTLAPRGRALADQDPQGFESTRASRLANLLATRDFWLNLA